MSLLAASMVVMSFAHGVADVGVPNNITFPSEPSLFEPGCVFIEQKPGVPADERYKVPLRWEKPGSKGCRIYVAHSPDGIHWKPYDEPSFRDSDTGNVVMWDDRVGRYVAYVRKWDSRGRDVPPRVVARCEFDDMADWGAETIVFASIEVERNGGESLYFDDISGDGRREWIAYKRHKVWILNSKASHAMAVLQASDLLLQVVGSAYPGPGKSIISFAWNPFAVEQNVILVGASDRAGLGTGIERLLELTLAD